MKLTTAGFITSISCMLFTSAPVWAEEDFWEEHDAVVESVNDPMESWNRKVYQFNQSFDQYVMKPVARGYDDTAPKPVKQSISNFFSNLSYPVVVANDLLQGKFLQGGSDFARFVVNSTVGVLGLFDPASHLDMVKHDEDLGQTFATWGVSEGPYLVLPFLGPASLRDGGGIIGDAYIDPLYAIDDIGARNALVASKAVDTRYRLLKEGDMVDEAAIDPYAFMRSAYRQARTQKISR